MQYRRLGRSGLRVSLLAYGTWITFVEQGDEATILANLCVAREAGINLFDTADGYGRGLAEERLGRALQLLGWQRSSYLLSTKLFSGTEPWVNMHDTLNRKYLLHGIDESLHRLRTTFVDLLYCHRPDPHTPLEEIVVTMSDIVASGKALYWGTSEWPAHAIREAHELAERYRLRKPSMEQPEYNLLRPSGVDKHYGALHDELGLGLVTWSPLASGLLTGKYRSDPPSGSRATLAPCSWLAPELTSVKANRLLQPLDVLASSMGATTAQLAIAWCVSNPRVSSVILGASRPEQLLENVRALDFLHRLIPEVRDSVAAAISSGA